jgi:cold shock CspA family protein
MNPVETGSTQSGAVESFDAAVGLGAIRCSDGQSYEFHCIEIANGTRQIDIGTAVTFEVLPKLGRYEASNIGS